jgi:hypothetical protein
MDGLEFMRLLLRNDRVTARAINSALRVACETNNLESVKLLLNDYRINAVGIHNALVSVEKNNKIDHRIIYLLSEDPRYLYEEKVKVY